MSTSDHLKKSDEDESSPQLDTGSSVQGLFQKARQVLSPSRLFGSILYLFAERKLLVFFGMHFVATMVIWSTLNLVACCECRDVHPTLISHS